MVAIIVPIISIIAFAIKERIEVMDVRRQVEEFYDSTMTTQDTPCNYFFINYGDGPVDIEPHQLGDIANDQYGNSWVADSELKWHQVLYSPNESDCLSVIDYEDKLFDAPIGLWKWKMDAEPIPTSKPSCKCAYCGCTNDHIYGTCDYCGAPLSTE